MAAWPPKGELFFLRKFAALVTSLSLIVTSYATAYSASDMSTDYGDHLKTGIVEVGYNSSKDKKVKVLVEKDGKRYQYNLRNDGEPDALPLQLGNGNYKVSVLENIEGNMYSLVSTKTVNLELEDEKQVYLNSNQLIQWEVDDKSTEYARALIQELKTDEEKIKAIYDFIVNNFTYDYVKLSNLKSGYLPDNDTTLENRKGICFDFSSLFASMLRSSGIHAKLVMGYTPNASGYHAWNEVYLKEKDAWVTIDSTVDMLLKYYSPVSMIKDSNEYNKVMEY